jgi:peptide deformylase
VQVVEHLRRVAGWVGRFHRFKPQVSRGLSAPQLQMAYRIAIVSRPADGESYDAGLFTDGYLELINPRIVAQTLEEVVEYEGCLTFFDVRGKVSRPWGIRVVYHGSNGPRTFTGTLARSIHHEIDHLDGKLYTDEDRMPARHKPISMAEYRELPPQPATAEPAQLRWLDLEPPPAP